MMPLYQTCDACFATGKITVNTTGDKTWVSVPAGAYTGLVTVSQPGRPGFTGPKRLDLCPACATAMTLAALIELTAGKAEPAVPAAPTKPVPSAAPPGAPGTAPTSASAPAAPSA